MLISPRPGADRLNIRKVLGGVHATAQNLQGHYDNAFEGLMAYLEWATDSARLLRSQVSDRDLEQLVFTPGTRCCWPAAARSPPRPDPSGERTGAT